MLLKKCQNKLEDFFKFCGLLRKSQLHEGYEMIKGITQIHLGSIGIIQSLLRSPAIPQQETGKALFCKFGILKHL